MNKMKLLSCRNLCSMLFISSLYLIGCSQTNEPEKLKEGNYFPSLSVGDTSLWDFYQMDKPAQSLRYTWRGKTKWLVVTIDSNRASKIATIQRIFSGRWYKYDAFNLSYPYSDSGEVFSDTSYFTVKDDGKSITIDLQSKSKIIQYFGEPFTFGKYFADSTQNEITLKPSNYLMVKIRKNYGLLYYKQLFGGGMLGKEYWYSRIE